MEEASTKKKRGAEANFFFGPCRPINALVLSTKFQILRGIKDKLRLFFTYIRFLHGI